MANKFLETVDNIGDLTGYMESDQFSAQDYVDILSNKYNHGQHPLQINPGWGYGFAVREALEKSPHNTPANNQKAIDQMVADPANLDDEHTSIVRETILPHLKTDKATRHKLLFDDRYMMPKRNGDLAPVTDALDHPDTKKEDLYRFFHKRPDQVDKITNHPKLDNYLRNKILEDPEVAKNHSIYDMNKLIHQAKDQDSDYDISPKATKNLLENSSGFSNDDFHHLLGKLPEEERKGFIDKKLGIAGGKPTKSFEDTFSEDTPENRAQFEKDNWQNWTPGEDHDSAKSMLLADSDLLDEDQIEHIKRHGDIHDKYVLYNNPNIDPKHGVEMFRKWHDDQDEHGYHAEELNQKNKQTTRDIFSENDLSDDEIEEIEEDIRDNGEDSNYARDNYSFEDWLSENRDTVKDNISLDDDAHQAIDDKLREEYDWEGNNPGHNSDLHRDHQKILDWMEENNKDQTNMEELKQNKVLGEDDYDYTGLQLDDIEDSDGDFSAGELEEHMGEINPESIDYSTHEDYAMHDHPEYQERWDEVVDSHKDDMLDDPHEHGVDLDSFYDDYWESDEYLQAREDVFSEIREDRIQDKLRELYDTSHQDHRLVPEHIRDHLPEYEKLKSNRKDGANTPFLNKSIKDRSHEHEYGEDQHFYEMARDYADKNGGFANIGSMHKTHPNLKDTWKKIFDGKSKLSTEEIQGKIDQIPKTKYDISYGKWGSDKMQNLNSQDQVIFRLDHSDDSIKPLKEDPQVYKTFKDIQNVSKQSGHPTNSNTIAWARVDTTDPEHWMVDEVQSDFGKTLTRYLKDNGQEEKTGDVEKIREHHKNWRETLLNKVINEAKKHGVGKISTHSPESKSQHTGSGKIHSVYKDSYGKVPRKMGFTSADPSKLPLSERAQRAFKQSIKDEGAAFNHGTAWKFHDSMADALNQKGHEVLADKHFILAQSHKTKAGNLTNDHDYAITHHFKPSGLKVEMAAQQAIAQNSPVSHEHDSMLNNDYSKPVNGHTLDLNAKLKKAELLTLLSGPMLKRLVILTNPNTFQHL